jgi:hemin uptake protein HemP
MFEKATAEMAKTCPRVEKKKISSGALFNNTRELMIEHDSEIYVLRITANNKLLLTK